MASDTRRYQALLTFTLIWVQAVLGAVFFQSSDELPPNIEYDFIVAGGGTGGGVVAARLAENPDWKILVIEAGRSNEGVFATKPPGLSSELIGTEVDWNYTTTSQSGINGRSTTYGRAKMLGGCSSHNGMAYTKGARDDWDRWARITENEGLSWDKMAPLFLKAENLVADSENQSENGHLDPALHGHDGNLFITAPYIDHPFNEMWLQATKELPDEFPFSLDQNNGRPIGISWVQRTIDGHAERSSSATAYIEPSGSNLHVLLNTYITRVLPVGNGTNFRGVEFAADALSTRKQLFARKEVIVSGGVIGTPQILMNSGIGKRDELEALGLDVLVDNPSVGKNFSDQVYTVIFFNTTIENTDFDLEEALAEWNATRTGPLIISGHLNDLISWVRLPDDASPFSHSGFDDPSPGPTAPHIEINPSQISVQTPDTHGEVPLPPDTGNITKLQLALINLHPVSRGSITLNSSDPFAYPNIDVGLLSEEVDLAILREGIRSARRLFSAPVFHDSVFGSVYPPGNFTSDEDLNTFIRGVAGPYLHGGCSASMSPRGAPWGVVDPDFRVKATTGLRIVDASVLPSVPSGHSQAAVYGFSERASVLIRETWER
ncbi:Choline dehydrogenase, mitochondrial [Leucoagaricus sp. SymC.cos]|nr:Choline dehydrogenase, mitochondrial [Leucoagaricus sp. SymC.cos]